MRLVPNHLHKLGILLRDVKRTNCADGLFCDFSISWTVPHFMLDPDDPEDYYSYDH